MRNQTKRSEFLAIRLTPDERAALERIATERTVSLASVLRWGVRRAMAEDPLTGRNAATPGVYEATGAAAVK